MSVQTQDKCWPKHYRLIFKPIVLDIHEKVLEETDNAVSYTDAAFDIQALQKKHENDSEQAGLLS